MNLPTIALFSPSMMAGGAERVVLNLARGYVQHGYRVHLLLASARGEFLEEIPPGAEVFDFGQVRVVRVFPKLIQYLRSHHPAILLSTQTHANVVAALAFLRAKTSTRLVLAEHSAISYNLGPPIHPLKGAILRTLARWLLPRADAIVAVSEGVARDLTRVLGIPNKTIEVIYNPIDLAHIQSQAKEEPQNRALLSDRRPLILSVGRLNNAKDYPTLLRAFARLRQHKDARLLILGEGAERPILERLIKDLEITAHVQMPGYVPNPYPYMVQADAFVMSSLWEGFPVVLVEALMCGTPIVATDCEFGPAEILGGGEVGKLVSVGDVVALADAMLQTLTSPADQEQLRQHALQFSFDAAMGKYIALMERLLAQPGSELKQ